MNIFISYKQTWVKKEELEENLSIIRDSLNELNHKNFIYYFDEDSNLEAAKINKIALENIKKSDLIIWFFNHFEKSEWQLLELGMSFALDKEILILVNNKYKDNFYLSYWLNWKILYFNNVSEIKTLITNYLKWNTQKI